MKKQNNRLSIRNGNIDGDYGWRAVAVSFDRVSNVVSIKPMISLKHSERLPGWCSSLQSLTKGDYVVMTTWSPEEQTLQLYQEQRAGRFTQMLNPNLLKAIVSKLPSSILKFLEPVGGGPSYLPSGYWRSKYDMCEKHDLAVLENFLPPDLPKEWKDYILQEALLAPKQHLAADWNSPHVKPLPNKLTNHTEIWFDEPGADTDRIHNSMVWILIDAKGSCRVVEPEPTSGNGYEGPTKRITCTYVGRALKMPEYAVKAIQVNLGAYEKDARSYGCRWYLYKA